MKRILIALFCASLVLTTGCNNKPEEQSSEEQTKPVMTEITSQIPAPVLTSAPIASETTTVTSEATVTSQKAQTDSDSSAEALITTQSAVTTQQQGGQGGEAHAEDPNPLYFNYRFTSEYVSMRLAGGNYQSLQYDFSEALEHDVDMLYTLDDFNFDGWADLCIPVHGFGTPNTQYIVYFWNPEQRLYNEKFRQYINPVCHPETKEVFTLQQAQNDTDGEETICIAEVYGWRPAQNEMKPKLIRRYTADFSALTLSMLVYESDSPDSPVITNVDSRDALEQAVLDLYLVS